MSVTSALSPLAYIINRLSKIYRTLHCNVKLQEELVLIGHTHRTIYYDRAYTVLYYIYVSWLHPVSLRSKKEVP